MINMADFVNAYKSASSRKMRQEFTAFLKPYYWKPYFWSRSYFICTVSDKSVEVVRSYIKTKNHKVPIHLHLIK